MISTAITKGLGGNATNMILGHFRLSKNITITPTATWYGGNGGSRPMAPGEIFNFYKPVHQTMPEFLLPGEDPILTRKFKLSVKIQTAKHDVTIHVPQKLNEPIVKIARFVSRMRIKAAIATVTEKIITIKAKILKD